jgi:hypothetical protein
MDNRINSNKGVVSRNLVYGKVYMQGNKKEFPGTDSTYKRLKNKTIYKGKGVKKTYGSKGKSVVE